MKGPCAEFRARSQVVWRLPLLLLQSTHVGLKAVLDQVELTVHDHLMGCLVIKRWVRSVEPLIVKPPHSPPTAIGFGEALDEILS